MPRAEGWSVSINCVFLWYLSLCVHALSQVWLFATPWPVARQAPLSIGFPRQELEWVVISFSQGSSWPRGQTRVSCVFCIGRQVLYLLIFPSPYILSAFFCVFSYMCMCKFCVEQFFHMVYILWLYMHIKYDYAYMLFSNLFLSHTWISIDTYICTILLFV